MKDKQKTTIFKYILFSSIENIFNHYRDTRQITIVFFFFFVTNTSVFFNTILYLKMLKLVQIMKGSGKNCTYSVVIVEALSFQSTLLYGISMNGTRCEKKIEEIF